MPSDVINAIDLVKSQHRMIRNLFGELKTPPTPARKARAFAELADLLTVHAAIEEHHLYPAIRAREAGAAVLGRLREPIDEHRNIKRALAELMRTSIATPAFDEKLRVLREAVEHHVRIEEEQVLPDVSKLLGAVQLHRLGRAMGIEAGQLEAKGAPRFHVASSSAGLPSI